MTAAAVSDGVEDAPSPEARASVGDDDGDDDEDDEDDTAAATTADGAGAR